MISQNTIERKSQMRLQIAPAAALRELIRESGDSE